MHARGNHLSMVSVYTIAISQCKKMGQKIIFNACKAKKAVLLKRFLDLLLQLTYIYNIIISCMCDFTYVSPQSVCGALCHIFMPLPPLHTT